MLTEIVTCIMDANWDGNVHYGC